MPHAVTWLGHGCFLIESDGHQIVIDPFLTENPAATVTLDQVAPQFIVVTHGHGDHVGDLVEMARRTGALVIANYEITEWAKRQGVDRVHAMNTGGGFNFPFGRLKLTIAQHSSMLPDGSNGGEPNGLLFTFPDGKNLYHAGDTALFLDMQLIADERLDLAILPIGDNYTMGPDDALRAVKLLRPGRVIPGHYNTWDVIAQDANAWAARVAAETATEPIVLAPGGRYEL